MYILAVYEGVAKESKRKFTSVTVLNDNRTSLQKLFASKSVVEKGIDEDLISNPDNGFVDVKIEVAPFEGIVSIEPA